MCRRLLLFFAFGQLVSADILYHVSVDTSSINGAAGSLDLNFNPGPLATQAANLQVLNFTSDGTLQSCAGNVQGYCNTGDVDGTLPATLTFDNGAALNDYFTAFTYGNNIAFDVRLYGPAVNSPDGVSTSGSTFTFSMFSDVAGTVPTLTTDPNGFAVTADVNLDGTAPQSSPSPQATVTPESPGAAPEPGNLGLMAILLLPAIYMRARQNPALAIRDQTTLLAG